MVTEKKKAKAKAVVKKKAKAVVKKKVVAAAPVQKTLVQKIFGLEQKPVVPTPLKEHEKTKLTPCEDNEGAYIVVFTRDKLRDMLDNLDEHNASSIGVSCKKL
jgi:hypothetical protein